MLTFFVIIAEAAEFVHRLMSESVVFLCSGNSDLPGTHFPVVPFCGQYGMIHSDKSIVRFSENSTDPADTRWDPLQGSQNQEVQKWRV